MKITIIYDNEVFKRGLKADWGFSCLVEIENSPKILFDTGANGQVLLSNMEKLGIAPQDISIVFISHSHWDHTGGLSDFLRENKDVKLYLPVTVWKRYNVKELIPVKNSTQIYKNVYSTGELMGVEQSLVVKIDKGLVIIAGCSHPGVENILESASSFGKVCAIIGGLHGFRDFSLIKSLDLVCPTHCTQYIHKIKKMYPEKYIEGGAGKIIEI